LGEGGEGEMKHGLITLLTLLFFATVPAAADVTEDPTPEAQIDVWCKKIVKSNGNGKILDGLQISPILLRRIAQLESLEEPWKVLVEYYGAPISCEKISQTAVGHNYVSHRILVHHQDMASQWYLTFYQSKTGWKLIGFNFNDTPEKPFDPTNGNVQMPLSDLPANSTT
jgi:hypothetical protein